MKVRAILCLMAMTVGFQAFARGQALGGDTVVQRDPGAPVGSEKNPMRVPSGVMFGLSVHRVLPKYPV